MAQKRKQDINSVDWALGPFGTTGKEQHEIAEAKKRKQDDHALNLASERFGTTEKEQIEPKPHYVDDALSTSLAEARKMQILPIPKKTPTKKRLARPAKKSPSKGHQR